MCATNQHLFRRPCRHVGTATAALSWVLLLTTVSPQSAGAQTLSVLHTFTGGADGENPSGFNLDSAGNLYAITASGGAANLGKVFKLDPTGKQSVLHSFAGGTDGADPTSLIRDSVGNLYGTTASGGAFGMGTIFKLDATGDETVLYSFPGAAGGFGPANLIGDAAGNLYGISAGGASNHEMVFKFSASGHASVLYSFPATGVQGPPVGALTLDSQGNLYGATRGLPGVCLVQHMFGSCGTVYKLSPTGSYSQLHLFFLGQPGGVLPSAGVIRDSAGNLYGTTFMGASPSQGETVFKLVPPYYGVIVLHQFARGDGLGGLLRDAAGNLYGTTAGGAFGQGTVSQLRGVSLSVLYSFTGASDGANPNSALVMDEAGNLYGATTKGGLAGFGTVFKLAR